MRALLLLPGLVLAAGLASCAYDPHPASPDTPGDPWHPPSYDAPSGGPNDAGPPPPASPPPPPAAGEPDPKVAAPSS